MTLGEDTAEVTHEALIREWPMLRGWLEEDREGIRLHHQLGTAARVWETGGRDRSDLYRGARLTATGDWAEHHREELNATERQFIDASLDEAERERHARSDPTAGCGFCWRGPSGCSFLRWSPARWR